MGRGFYVKFDVPEIQNTLNQVSSYKGKTLSKIENAVQRSTKAIRKGAVSRIHSETGKLKKKTTSSFDKKTVTGTIRSKSPVAHLVEFGAKATTVTSKSKKALTIDEFGNRNYARKANIPVRRARPYMRPAFEDEKPTLIRGLEDAVKP